MSRSTCVVLFVVLAAPAMARDGGELYGAYCGQCHDGGIVRAPSRRALSELTPQRIVAALETGSMRVPGADLLAFSVDGQ